MNTKDLMIGDWVNYRGTHIQVTSLYNKGASNEIGWGDMENTWVNGINIDPILLTKEILEANGFMLDKRCEYAQKYVYPIETKKIPQTILEFNFYDNICADTLFICWAKPESCDGENSVHICDLKYVHQLQHALRLCGIEKEIVV